MNSEEQNHICIRAKLVAKREGNYTVYVFKKIDATDYRNSFIMCTKCYNWQGIEPDLHQEGFLSYNPVRAGVDTWYNNSSDEHLKYAYSANYFLDFVPVTHVLNNGTVVEKNSFILT